MACSLASTPGPSVGMGPGAGPSRGALTAEVRAPPVLGLSPRMGTLAGVLGEGGARAVGAAAQILGAGGHVRGRVQQHVALREGRAEQGAVADALLGSTGAWHPAPLVLMGGPRPGGTLPPLEILFICPSACPSMYPLICLSVPASTHPPVHPSVHPPTHWSTHPSFFSTTVNLPRLGATAWLRGVTQDPRLHPPIQGSGTPCPWCEHPGKGQRKEKRETRTAVCPRMNPPPFPRAPAPSRQALGPTP